MRAIVRKALADIRGRPLQVVLLLLVIGAAATTLSVALNVQASASKPYERLREEANGADVWVHAAGETTDLSKLRDIRSVAEVGEPYPVSWESYAVSNGEDKQEFVLAGLGPTLPAFDHPVVTSGRWLSQGGTDEIVLDSGAANLLDLQVGQTVDLLTPHGPRSLTLVGLAVTAGRNPAPIDNPAFAYVLPEVLYDLTPGVVYGRDLLHPMRVGVRLEPFADDGLLLSELRTLGGPYTAQRWEGVREVSTEANQFDVIFLQVFALFALFASGLIIANAVGGQVLTQLHDTGILKAIGFTPRQVTATLLVHNLGLSLLGVLAGVVASQAITPFFLKRTADILGVPATAPFDPVLTAITALVIVATVSLFTFMPAWRAGRVSVIYALGGEQVGDVRVSRLARVATRLRLPRVAVVAIKDLLRRPMRTAMMVVALVIAVVTATFSLGIESTLDKTMSDPTVIGGPPYDIDTELDTLADNETRTLLEANQDIETYLAVWQTVARVGGRGLDLWAFDGDLNQPEWAMRQGRMPRQAGEAAISTTMAREFNLSSGDTVEITVFAPDPSPEAPPRQEVEIPLAVTIVGVFVSTEGEIMHVTRETMPWERPPTNYLIKTRPGANDREVARALFAASGGNLDPEVLSEIIRDIRDQWRPVLLGLNFVLLVIAGINLLSSQLLSVRERRRDFAVLKTLGFTPAQIVASVLVGAALLSFIAVAIGIPLGLVASRIMFDILSSAAGIGTGVGELPSIVWLAPLVPLILLVTALASALPARIAASLQVAEALRHE